MLGTTFIVFVVVSVGDTLMSSENKNPHSSKLKETENLQTVISMVPDQLEKNRNNKVNVTIKYFEQKGKSLEYTIGNATFSIDPPPDWIELPCEGGFTSSFKLHINTSVHIPSGHHSITANMSLRVFSRRKKTGPIVGNTSFLIFDCQSYTSCTECLPSKFPCDWSEILGRCIYYHPTDNSSEFTFVSSFFHCNAKQIVIVSIAIILILIITSIVVVIAYRRKSNAYKNTHKHIDVLESTMASEFREAFTELQTEKADTIENFKKDIIPFLDYTTYVTRNLFPNSDNNGTLQTDPPDSLIKEKELDMFKELIMNKTFLLQFIRTLESRLDFSMTERVRFASLITVALENEMDYYTEILKELLSELITKYMDGKCEPKLLLRQAESVAEKMLSSWFTIHLHDFVRKCAGKPLYYLFRAMKQQVDKGPVDAITAEARYSLSEVKLIRQVFDFKPMTVKVSFGKHENFIVNVLDCDTISQVKEKALDAIYGAKPYSERPEKEDVDVMWRNGNAQSLELNDYDETNTIEGEWIQMNTLKHYNVPIDAHLILLPREINLGEKTEGLSKKTWHLVKEDYNRVQKKNKESNCNKMVSEVYLTRLLTTKGALQPFIIDLFQTIFSTNKSENKAMYEVPLPIRYMFEFLDDQALKHNIKDPEVVHIWKSNALPLRFWVNMIKNPNFVFNIYKSNIIDSCLSVVAQALMDSCSKSEHRLETTSKLLFTKDIPAYKEMVEQYYADIKNMSSVSDSQLKEMKSKLQKSEIKTNRAFYELYDYAFKHNIDIIEALEKNKLSQKEGLAQKARKSFGTLPEFEISLPLQKN